jgi:hypothetical protein
MVSAMTMRQKYNRCEGVSRKQMQETDLCVQQAAKPSFTCRRGDRR